MLTDETASKKPHIVVAQGYLVNPIELSQAYSQASIKLTT